MCQKKEPNTYTWKCGYTTAEFTGARIYMCEPARARGSQCANPTPIPEDSGRAYVSTDVCQDCRKKEESKRGNDGSTGTGGSMATSAKYASTS